MGHRHFTSRLINSSRLYRVVNLSSSFTQNCADDGGGMSVLQRESLARLPESTYREATEALETSPGSYRSSLAGTGSVNSTPAVTRDVVRRITPRNANAAQY